MNPEDLRPGAITPTSIGATESVYGVAYGPKAMALLGKVPATTFQANMGFIARFHHELRERKQTAEILRHLDEDEQESLRRDQQQHLQCLLSPHLGFEEHFKKAYEMGQVHESVGVTLPMLLDFYHLYQQEVEKILGDISLSNVEHEQLGKVLLQRLLVDMEAQISSHTDAHSKITEFLIGIDKFIDGNQNLCDLLQVTTQAIIELAGVEGCLFLRPDRKGVFQIEAVGGAAAERYVEGMQERGLPMLRVQSETPAGQGPAGVSWRTAEIQVIDSYRQCENLTSWTSLGSELGFRSCASIPLLDETGQPFALFALYSGWPRYFSSSARHMMLRHLQQRLGHAVSRCESTRVMPVVVRQHYREHLNEDALEMHYQPIVDLRTGELTQLEALARLRTNDGKLVRPGVFLPALGKADLLQLFQLGLMRIVRDWPMLGVRTPVSINLPPEGLIDDAYRDAIFDSLDAGQLETQYLELEILEYEAPSDYRKRSERLKEFRDAGLKIVQDDLGSGHSSLLRLDQFSFDAVKIDQGLVRSASKTPQSSLDFIYYLTRLAHCFGMQVTVEGLEDLGLIEAATILGADCGQGYGVARPMPASDLEDWINGWSYRVNATSPRTALGALAGYLLWDQQLSALEGWPDLIEDFVRTPCVVSRYFQNSEPNNTALRVILEHNHACALRGGNGMMYRRTKAKLIEMLATRWRARPQE